MDDVTHDHDNEKASEQGQKPAGKSSALKRFFRVRVIGGVALAVIALWGVWILVGLFRKPAPSPVTHVEEGEPPQGVEEAETPVGPSAASLCPKA